MICPHCKRLVPDGLLACPECTRKRSDDEFARYQSEPLRRVRQGTGRLTLRRIKNVWHVQMFGFDMAFCGEAVQRGTGAITTMQRVDYKELATMPYPCKVCRQKLDAAMEVACRAIA